MDKGHYGNTSVVYKTLGDFLKDLGGIEFYNLLSEDFSQDLLQGFVSFSQFISMDRSGFNEKDIRFRVTQDVLKEAFIRNIALVLPAGMKGADMVIPVLLPDNTFSCVVLQIKNLDDTKLLDGTALAKVCSKLSPNYLNFLDLETPLTKTPRATPADSPVKQTPESSVPEKFPSKRARNPPVNESAAKNAKTAKTQINYLPLIIQFSPQISSREVETFSVVEYAGNNYVHMLGLKAFDHLLHDKKIKAILQNLINGEFPFTLKTTMSSSLNLKVKKVPLKPV